MFSYIVAALLVLLACAITAAFCLHRDTVDLRGLLAETHKQFVRATEERDAHFSEVELLSERNQRQAETIADMKIRLNKARAILYPLGHWDAHATVTDE